MKFDQQLSDLLATLKTEQDAGKRQALVRQSIERLRSLEGPQFTTGHCENKAQPGDGLLAVTRRQMEWRPIETAPVSKDIFLGDVSPCLVYGPDVGVRIGRAWRYADGTVGADSAMLCGDWEYTHWMPLPAPPSEA